MKQYRSSHIITSSEKKPEASVLIVYTGGTLGMIHSSEGTLVPFDFKSMLEHIPSLRQLPLNLTVIAFEEPIDSSDITPDDWINIGDIINTHYNEFDGFVVLHGTDTMAYTASALSFMLRNLGKPVIFTGAQLPISSPRSDARENLITALEIASAKAGVQPVVAEVAILFNNILLRGNRSKKVESVYFDAFESENYPILAESGININFNEYAFFEPPDVPELTYKKDFDTNVAVLKLYPGISKNVVESVLSTPGLRGVVMETFGSGNASTADWFLALLRKALKNNIVIINVSQCTGGRVLQGRYETSRALKEMGIVSGADLTLEAAVCKLMMTLAEEIDIKKIVQRMTTPISGEMTL